MSDDITAAFRKMWADNFRDKVQQTQSRLMKTVRVERGLTGTGKQIEFVEAIDDTETTGQRYRQSVFNDLTIDARWYFPREFKGETAESAFDESKLKPTIMGQGKHLTAHERAFNRRCDNLIINSLTGTAHTGENGTTSTALPSTQIVPVDFVHTGSDADSGLTAPKLIESLRILAANEAWNEEVAAAGEKVWVVVDAKEQARLTQEANRASGDRMFSREFGAPPVFGADGFISSWGALNFVLYNGLLTDTVVGSAGTDTVSAKVVPVYVSSALEFGVWDNFVVTVDRIPTRSNAILFQSQYRLGAGREQEKKVVRIDVTVA